MNVHAFLAQHEVRFISLEEVIQRLMQRDGASRCQAMTALYLVLQKARWDELTWLHRPSPVDVVTVDAAEQMKVKQMLREATSTPEHELAGKDAKSTDAWLTQYGFYRTEVQHLLLMKGMDVDLGVDGSTLLPPGSVTALADWKRILALKPQLSQSEVACAFVGVDPSIAEWMSTDTRVDWQRWMDRLEEAVVRGELPADHVSYNAEGHLRALVTPADLAAWCEGRWAYPLPPWSAPAKPAADSSLPTRVDGSETPARWPWGNYTTRGLELVADTVKHLWSPYDPAQPDTAPTNEQVVDDLMAKGVSRRQAEVIASLLRADDLQTGRRKGNGD